MLRRLGVFIWSQAVSTDDVQEQISNIALIYMAVKCISETVVMSKNEAYKYDDST